MENRQNLEVFKNYVKVIFTVYLMVFIFRVFETTMIFHSFGFTKDVLFSELIGLISDILETSIPLGIYIVLYFFLYKINKKIIRIVNLSFLLIVTLSFYLIIKYFLYQLIPLDIFLYNYPIKEILFTVKTSGLSYFEMILGFVFVLILIALGAWTLSRISFSKITIKVTYLFVVTSLPLFFVFHYLCCDQLDKFATNKPIYFISKTIKYFGGTSKVNIVSNIDGFKGLYPDRKFINDKYPLIYEINRKNELGKYFDDFESSPNVVIIIVEGLNDDFIHEYKGALLMPFLNGLKDKSLYWERCFTLGERSFAVVPSILGGLPYGDRGFTLQERLPRHTSLVSVLNSNHYFTSFFYGQGAWFHKKDRFFKYNNANLILDNSNFSEGFDKIIFGDDRMFLGYNDKDLFKQSLHILDTINSDKRLDIYFTGTSHSPFIINNEDYYNKRLEQLITEPYNKFYSTYSKQLKTLLFVDDALKDYFNEYKKRNDYSNTIFIITGDHPMTEIPIANSLKRYHVPLIIFSEKIKEPQTFSNIVSHLDVSETLLSFLQDNLNCIPTIGTSLGTGLLPRKDLQTKNIAFMNGNREVVDFLSDNYFLAGDKLYYVNNDLNITNIKNNSIKSILTKKLDAFLNISLSTCRNNAIISGETYCEMLNLRCLYSSKKTDTLNTSSTYYDITDKIKIPNSDFVFDISINSKSDENSDISIVHQITDYKDSTLSWHIFPINKNKITQAHVPVNKISVNDSIIYFKTYLWNKNKNDLMISDIDVLLYEANSVLQ